MYARYAQCFARHFTRVRGVHGDESHTPPMVARINAVGTRQRLEMEKLLFFRVAVLSSYLSVGRYRYRHTITGT